MLVVFQGVKNIFSKSCAPLILNLDNSFFPNKCIVLEILSLQHRLNNFIKKSMI